MGRHPTEKLTYGRIQNVNPKTIVKGFKMGPRTLYTCRQRSDIVTIQNYLIIIET